MRMRRGWEVQYKDGTIVNETQLPWRKVVKRNIHRLSLFFDGRRWDLIGKEAYFVENSASIVPGIQESFQIEKRKIGFYEGATKVYYIVDEFTGAFKMEVIDNSGS